MAQADAISGSALLIKVGDGATPTETFTHPCSINAERGVEFSAETRNNNIPDCDDPEAIVWQGTEKASKSCSVNGAGTLHAADDAMFFAWFNSKDPKNVKIMDGNRIYTGAFHLTQYRKTGNVGEKIQAAITLVADGAVTDEAAP